MIPKNCQWVDGWVSFRGNNVVPRIDYIDNKFLDVPYGDDPLQVMDIYLPNAEIIPRPVFILIHGGGFSHCDKRDFHLYPGFFALERGYTLVSINYRLAPQNPYPDGLNDVKSAMIWICEHAKDYGFDPDRLFLFGPSAGGNFSALAALQSADFLRNKGTVRAAAALCPAADLVNIRKHYQSIPNRTPFLRLLLEHMFRQYFGSRYKDAALLEQASYMPYVHKGIPPMYLQIGDKDPLIPLKDVQQMYQQLREVIGEENVVLDVIPGGTHSGGDENYYLRENITRILDFFARYEHVPY